MAATHWRRAATGAGFAALIALTPILAACNGEDSAPTYTDTSETSSSSSPSPTP